MNEHASVIDRPSIQPMRGTEGSPIIGPTNPAREAQNLDRLAPPRTDHGTLPNLKWSFADCHNKLEEGGWACLDDRPRNADRHGTRVREHAPGGGRGAGDALAQSGRVVLHDKGPRPRHGGRRRGQNLPGRCRRGRSVDFPPACRIDQGLAGEGCEFLLVFDDGAFNEDETFLVTDFLAHIPPVVLAKNFGVSERAFASIPKSELYIFRSNVPGPLAQDRVVGAGPTPVNDVHRMQAQVPIRTRYGMRPHHRTRPISPRCRRSRLDWSRWSRAACANSTGIGPPTRCNITSKVRAG